MKPRQPAYAWCQIPQRGTHFREEVALTDKDGSIKNPPGLCVQTGLFLSAARG